MLRQQVDDEAFNITNLKNQDAQRSSSLKTQLLAGDDITVGIMRPRPLQFERVQAGSCEQRPSATDLEAQTRKFGRESGCEDGCGELSEVVH